MENKESFEYTYSAPEQEEVRKIRDKYLPREERENKLEQLRRLDRSVTEKGNGRWHVLLHGLDTSVRNRYCGWSCGHGGHSPGVPPL